MKLGIFYINAFDISKETVIEYIDHVADSGLNAFGYHFSNGGAIQFGLDDMIVKTPYGEYDLTPCLTRVKENGENTLYITETEMNEILDYAKSKNVEFIPTLDVPGHMSYILSFFPELVFDGVTDSVNIKSEESIAFAYALVEKYADYFKAHGCKYFNIGADEFAQELNGEMGFETIYQNGEMKYFVKFMNGLISILCDKGYEVMGFNDGICYAEDAETYGKIDTRLIVLYWSPGWGRKFASPLYLERQGYRVLNSYHSFYIDENTRDFESRLKNHQEMQINSIDGDWRFKINNGVGAQFCCWSIHDVNPNEYMNVLAPHIKAFGEAFKAQL